MNIGLAKLRCTMLALRAKESKIEGYSEGNLLELKKFIEEQEAELRKQTAFNDGNKVTISKFEGLIEFWRKTCDGLNAELTKAKKMIEGQDELIAQLNEDSDAQDKLVNRYEKALEVIDDALEKAATDEVEGEDPAVPTGAAAGFAGPYGISADGGGCNCEICIGWRKRRAWRS